MVSNCWGSAPPISTSRKTLALSCFHTFSPLQKESTSNLLIWPHRMSSNSPSLSCSRQNWIPPCTWPLHCQTLENIQRSIVVWQRLRAPPRDSPNLVLRPGQRPRSAEWGSWGTDFWPAPSQNVEYSSVPLLDDHMAIPICVSQLKWTLKCFVSEGWKCLQFNQLLSIGSHIWKKRKTPVTWPQSASPGLSPRGGGQLIVRFQENQPKMANLCTQKILVKLC